VTRFYSVLALLSWPLIHGLYRLRAQGVENLPQGGFVISANHTSNLDPWPLGLPLWPRRQLHFMGKAELFNPVLGPPLRAAGAFPVRRGRGGPEAIRTAVELVRAGRAVAIFPEGTRRVKGRRKKLQAKPHNGAARIALEAGVPLIPAAVAGTDRLSRFPRVRVVYGKPIELDDLKGTDVRQASRIATERLMEEIERLHRSL
jgi:1-acyl-sn-glycerol-3-phosphate acyltransferase